MPYSALVPRFVGFFKALEDLTTEFRCLIWGRNKRGKHKKAVLLFEKKVSRIFSIFLKYSWFYRKKKFPGKLRKIKISHVNVKLTPGNLVKLQLFWMVIFFACCITSDYVITPQTVCCLIFSFNSNHVNINCYRAH